MIMMMMIIINNLIKKKAEKIIKYEDLAIEIQRTWNVWTGVITGATGTISKSFRSYLSNIPGKQEINELQKAATLGTAHVHVLRKVLV